MELLARDSLQIVHVEDDDHFFRLSEIFLKRAGFEQPIIRCKDGVLAVHYFSMIQTESAPDVILLDVDMPRMSGLKVLHWLRQTYSDQNVAIFMLTSSDDSANVRAAAADDVTGYLLKSPYFSELIHKLDLVISVANRKQLEEMRQAQDVMAELALMGTFADDMVVLSDVHGRIAWVNDRFVRTCGFSLPELLGKKPHSLLDGPGSNHASVEKLHDAIRSVSSCECRTINHKKDGTTYPVHISLGPVFDKGRLAGFLSVEQDLSDQNGVLTP